jgi:hypothetical protein
LEFASRSPTPEPQEIIMRTRNAVGGILVAALLIAGCQDAGPIAASPDGAFLAVAEMAAPVRPFKGSFAGTSSHGAPCGEDPWIVALSVVGQGNATHLGRTRLDLTACWDWSTFTPAGPVAARFTAANGDEVWMTAGDFVIEQETGVMTSRYFILGGTGRFEAAQGELDVRGQLFPDLTWMSEAIGWMAY